MSDKVLLQDAIMDETLYLISDFANLTITANNLDSNLPIQQISPELMILYSSMPEKGLNDSSRDMLQRLITAIQLPPSSVCILEINGTEKTHFKILEKHYHPKRLLLFGVSAEMLGLHLALDNYKLLTYKEIVILSCYAIENIDKVSKSLLWDQLKKMFGIK